LRWFAVETRANFTAQAKKCYRRPRVQASLFVTREQKIRDVMPTNYQPALTANFASVERAILLFMTDDSQPRDQA